MRRHVLTGERCPNDVPLHDGNCLRCAVCRNWVDPSLHPASSCPGPAEHAPPVDPDPDEVRRALTKGIWATHVEVQVIDAAARAWLRLREQQPAPSISIAQVVEACMLAFDSGNSVEVGIAADGYSEACFARINVPQSVNVDGKLFAVCEGGAPDTPEAALRQLYDDAVKKLREQARDANDKLAKLGVEP